jgi:NAD(P)H-dependent flavin oxidoreductase YrpB (nitropropane dioxygenase family)
MDMSELIKAVAGNGAWGLLAVFLIKYFMEDKTKTIELLTKNHKESIEDMKEDKDKLMEIVISQKELLAQMKDILARQTEMLSRNEDTLDGVKVAIDKIVDIQVMHANRLEKIEDRIEQVEKQILKK